VPCQTSRCAVTLLTNEAVVKGLVLLLKTAALTSWLTGGSGNEDERGILMVSEVETNVTIANPASNRPLVTSYDSGYEHSLEHWLDVKQLVEAAAVEPAGKAALLLAKAS